MRKEVEALYEYCANRDIKVEIKSHIAGVYEGPPLGIMVVCEVDGIPFRWVWHREPDDYLVVIERLEDYFKNKSSYGTDEKENI